MRITCPSCAAEYDVPGALAPGRTVKCAKCGGKWAPVPSLPPPPPPPPPVIEAREVPAAPIASPPTPPPPTPPAPPVGKAAPPRLLLLAWAGSILVLAGLVTAAIMWREPVMAAWPPSVRVYAALRLAAHP